MISLAVFLCLMVEVTFNNFLLTGGKFILKSHLRQPRFTYSTCGPFTKYCERIQKFREIGNLNICIETN